MNRIQNTRKRLTAAKGEGGFTLIELLIVIVVLGILAAVVVFALGGVTGQSAVAACNADSKTVSVAISAYEANEPNAATVAPTSGSTSNLIPKYLKSWPSNASYYTIGVDSTTLTNPIVTVQLTSNDPGATATGANAGGTVGAVGSTTAYNYEGSAAFAYATPATLLNDNICQGA